MIWLSDKNAPDLVPLKKTYNISGKNYSFESGKLGLLSSWAITMSDEFENIVFTSVWFKTEWLNLKADFFPLVVDFQEKFYATWIIWWNRFQRREWRASDEATLTARLIDRPIRPMFPKWIINDTQIIVSVLSATWEKDLWTWGITSASLWLMIAWTPFEWPVSGVRVVLDNAWSWIYDPSTSQEKEAKLNLIVAWTVDAITMVEAGWSEVSDEEMMVGLEFAHNIIKDICKAQIDFTDAYKKSFWIPELQATYNNPDLSLYDTIKEFLTEEKLEVLYEKWKKDFQHELDNLDLETRDFLREAWHIIDEKSGNIWDSCLVSDKKTIDENEVWNLVYKRVKEVMRKTILETGRRLDGRNAKQVRKVVWEVWLLPRTHGSALFQRGMTQALSIATLWWPDDAMTIWGMMPEWEKRYIHQYNFPPFSVWEVRMLRWVGRREIGHWALAERALVPVLPSEAEFPYVIRVVSEITTCNWSSSMASVCGSTMSLMQAWVPIKAPVWWVAIGMIYEESTGKYVILSDIQAQEDFLWDMDFKLTRTSSWITAMQLDVKIKWLSMQVFRDAFSQWKEAVDYILEEMHKIIPETNKNLSKYAPLIMTLAIPVDKIRWVIWKWWENVQALEKDYACKISIADDGLTTITAKTQETWNIVIEKIKSMIWEPEVWYKWIWKVVKIIDWTWVLVEFAGKTGMIHISKLSFKRIEKVEQILNLWDEVKFEIIEVDMAKWRIGLKRELSEAELKELADLKAQKEAELKKKMEDEQKAKAEAEKNV